MQVKNDLYSVKRYLEHKISLNYEYLRFAQSQLDYH
jgi:hypothetical protein